MATETKTFYPKSYDASASSLDSISNATNPVGKGSSNTTYAEFYGKTGAETKTAWPFDVSAIPEEATIDSVVCKAKAGHYNSYYVNSCSMQLYSGSTPKGSAADFKNSAGSVITLNVGTWTRTELASCRLVVRGTATSATPMYRSFRFYGADLTVTYTYQSEKFMLRLDSDAAKLPSGYTQLEYIEATGNQYIDWGFKPNQDTRVVFDFEPASVDGTHLFGCRSASSASDFFLLICTGGTYRDDYAADKLSTGIAPGERVVIDKNKNVTKIGGETFTHEYTSFSASYPIVLFASNTGGTVGLYASGNGYRAQAYNNGTLIRDCYPCLNPSNVPGLYDIVNGVFYGSATSTPFVAGPVYNKVWHDIARVFKKISGIWVEQEELANVVDQSKRLFNGGEYVLELPEGYTRLEYIESAGAQYIDTEFLPNQDTRVVCDVQMVSEDSAFAANAIFGTRVSSTSKTFAVQWNISGSMFQHFYNDGHDNLNFGDFDIRQIVDMNKNVLSLDGATNERTYGAFQCDRSLYVFALNNAGAPTFNSRIRLYSCRIYDNDVLVRDYIPCLNSSDVPGLYDRVNGVFRSSASGIDFDYPGKIHLISFTIKGISYQAEEGMTFGEWVESDYNTGGFYSGAPSSLAYIYSPSGERVYDDDNAKYSLATETIVSGRAYLLT